MSKRISQPRNRHIVAVIALLISSVGGFAPQARQTRRYHSYPNAATCSATTAVAAAAWLSAQQQTSMRERGLWDGVGARRRSGALCQQRWGFGVGEGPAADQRARKLFPPAGGAAGSPGARLSSSFTSSRSYRRGSSSLSMALHFPKPPKLPKPPPPGDKAPAAGGGKSGSAGSSNGDHESSSLQTATTRGGLLPQPATGKSGGGASASGGVTGVSGLDAKEGKGSAGHANGARADLNGSKVSERALEQGRTLVWHRPATTLD